MNLTHEATRAFNSVEKTTGALLLTFLYNFFAMNKLLVTCSGGYIQSDFQEYRPQDCRRQGNTAEHCYNNVSAFFELLFSPMY